MSFVLDSLSILIASSNINRSIQNITVFLCHVSLQKERLYAPTTRDYKLKLRLGPVLAGVLFSLKKAEKMLEFSRIIGFLEEKGQNRFG